MVPVTARRFAAQQTPTYYPPPKPNPVASVGSTTSEALPIKNGNAYTLVLDLHVAAALMASGIPLVSKPVKIVFDGGVTRTLFTFSAKDPDGELNVPAAAKAAALDPVAYIAANPRTPFACALAGVIQICHTAAMHDEAQAMSALQAPGSKEVKYAAEGSPIEKRMLDAGYKRLHVDAETPIEQICKRRPPSYSQTA